MCAFRLTKKIVFADSLAPVVADIFFLGPQTTAVAWTGAWLFTFRIYFDFPGYSDIAIGCAHLLGIPSAAGIKAPLSGFGRSLGSGHLSNAGHRVCARLLSALVSDLVPSIPLETR